MVLLVVGYNFSQVLKNKLISLSVEHETNIVQKTPAVWSGRKMHAGWWFKALISLFFVFDPTPQQLVEPHYEKL